MNWVDLCWTISFVPNLNKKFIRMVQFNKGLKIVSNESNLWLAKPKFQFLVEFFTKDQSLVANLSSCRQVQPSWVSLHPYYFYPPTQTTCDSRNQASNWPFIVCGWARDWYLVGVFGWRILIKFSLILASFEPGPAQPQVAFICFCLKHIFSD